MITDNYNKYVNDEGRHLKECKTYQTDTETESKQTLLEKMAPIDLLDLGLSQAFNL